MSVQEPTSNPLSAPSKLLRPLPRKRVERFVWAWQDTAWVSVAALVAILCLFWVCEWFEVPKLSYIDAILLTVSLYVAGLKLHSRIAAVASSLLIATNLPMLELIGTHPQMGLVIAGTAALVSGSDLDWLFSIPIFPLFLATSWREPVVFVIGMTFLVVRTCIKVFHRSTNQKPEAMPVLAIIALITYSSLKFSHSIHLIPYLDLTNPIIGTAFYSNLWWFLIPFLPEVVSPSTREKWILPVTIIAIICLLPAVQTWVTEPLFAVAIPLQMLMVAVGLGRLIPLIAGEYQKPWMRYLAATLAVAGALSMQAVSMGQFKNDIRAKNAGIYINAAQMTNK